MAVSSAVLNLLQQGGSNFSAGEVAQLADVNRAPVHRRWPTRADLIQEALKEHSSKIKIPDTGSFEGDIRQLSRELRKFLSDPVELGLNAAMATFSDPEFNRWIIDYWLRFTRNSTPGAAARRSTTADPQVD